MAVTTWLTELLRKLWSGRAEVQVEFQVANGLAEYSSWWEPLGLCQMRVSIHDASPIHARPRTGSE